MPAKMVTKARYGHYSDHSKRVHPLTLLICGARSNRRFPDWGGCVYNRDSIDVVGASACRNLRVIVKRLRLLNLAPQREVARLKGECGEHISATARTTTEIGETRLQIIQLERAFKEQVVTDLRALADECAADRPLDC